MSNKRDDEKELIRVERAEMRARAIESLRDEFTEHSFFSIDTVELDRVGEAFMLLTDLLWSWQQDTFGPVETRMVKGVLRHLVKEAKEACEANDLGCAAAAFRDELADCQILLWEAVRRSGMTHLQFFAVIAAKTEKNMARQWPTPTADKPIEHIKQEEFE